MQTRCLLLLGALIAAVLYGCGEDEGDDAEVTPETFFDSDVPSYSPPGPVADSGAGGAGGTTGVGGGAGSGGQGGSGEKAIEEADIVKLEGSRLYALSKYGGLSIVDVSVKDQLKVLGRYELSGEPFEMYVKGGVAFAMYSMFGHWEGSGDGALWVQSSAIVALDVKTPSAIKKLGEFLLPGTLSDSRIVGDVLYAVAHENGGCWKCAGVERTNLVSLNLKDPSKVAKVDELSFAAPPGAYGAGRRSVTVSGNRMFLGGRDATGTQGSTIQVVDISDPTGKLVQGASVTAAGSIESRWQMDERDGVLRVVSQPGWWSTTDPPVVQTFQIVSSQEVKPLASLPMLLPEPERLRSVRFDGARGYAITFRQTDPLFVIDLSVPSAPKQVGELTLPGWVYHIEPRGDRLLALGFDQSKPGAALNVSLFDVADATKPALLDRVDFGGAWGELAEDQDRIHKAFTILDALGLIFVPYSGFSTPKDYPPGCAAWESGIQIVSFTKDELTERGVAPSRGTARRAFLHESRLFAVSDVAVETFDIADLDAPKPKASIALAPAVSKLVVAGNQVARLGSDVHSTRSVLDVVPLARIDGPSENAVDLEALLGTPEESKCWYGHFGASNIQLFANGSQVYLVAGFDERRIAIFDVASGAPVLAGKHVLPGLGSQSPYEPFGAGYQGGVSIPDSGTSTVQLGSTLVTLRRMATWQGSTVEVSFAVDVIDLADPKNPKHASLPLVEALGMTGLIVAGGDALFSHWAPSPVDATKVRFYVDRVDVASPAAPKLSSTNVPGSLLAADPTGKRALTVSYEKVSEQLDAQSCYEKWAHLGQFEPAGDKLGLGTCTAFRRGLSLAQLGTAGSTVLDTEPLADSLHYSKFQLGDDRVFLATQPMCPGCGPPEPPEVLVLGGLAAGQLTVASVAAPGNVQTASLDTLLADGTRAVVLGGYPRRVGVLDATTPSTPKLKIVATTQANAFSYQHLPVVVGDTLVLPQGPYGVETVDLTP